MSKVSIFHIGPQKSATTWLYRCFLEHPQLVCGKSDAINYFDIFYNLGEEWYHKQFLKNGGQNKILIDMTPSYIRGENIPRHIHSYNKDAKIILTIRDPIERAFSHYWHNKKKSEIDVSFDKVFRNYDFFNSWIETGFYAEHIERFLKYFDREQLLVQDFRLLKENPEKFLSETLEFINVSTNYKPSVLSSKVNIAKNKKTKGMLYRERVYRRLGIVNQIEKGRWVFERLGMVKSLEIEKLENSDALIIAKLKKIYEPHIQKLEDLVDLDLNDWRNH